MSSREPTQIDGLEFIKTSSSGSAILVTDGSEDYWIPVSQIDSDSDLNDGSERGEVGCLVVPLWLAEEKGLV